MSKRDSIKLDIIDQIDDDIIEEVTVKRYKLSRRRIIYPRRWATAVIAAVLLLFVGLFMPFMFSNKQVPVYKGMTVISSYYPNYDELGLQENDQISLDMLSQFNIDGLSDLSDMKNHKFSANKLIRTVNHDDPFDHNDNGKSFIEAIKKVLNYSEGTNNLYYAKPGEDIFINIHFDNPGNYEILSFTLNGQKYSSYMFENGSDMENLILKVNVGDKPGIVEYTIDAIKYVDGNRIKNVVMKGDRTVRVGINSDETVSANVISEDITFESLSLEILVTDNYEQIKTSNGGLALVLYDGNSIISTKEIFVGEANKVIFDNLTPDTLYQYAIVAVYDKMIGEGMDLFILSENAFYTNPVLSYTDLSITQDSIDFSLIWAEGFEDRKVESLELYLENEKVCDLDSSATHADGLLSNNQYRIVAKYRYKGAYELSTLVFYTNKSQTPDLWARTISITISSFLFSIKEEDPDNNGSISKIELLSDNDTSVVAENTDIRRFDNLLSNNDYVLKVTYSYDLNDGKGIQEIVRQLQFTTLKKEEAVITLKKSVLEGTSIAFDISVVDNNNVFTLKSVEVLKDDTVIESFDHIGAATVGNLEPDSNYKIIVRYYEDMNDSTGIQEKYKTFFMKTGSSYVSNGISYYCKDGYCEIKAVDKNIINAVINIPEGFSMSSLSKGLFTDNKNLKSVVVNGVLHSIGEEAFSGCENLETVVLPDTVRTIEKNAFAQCKSLKTFSIPAKVNEIADGTFANCSQLSEVVIPDILQKIGDKAFYRCESLTNVVLSYGIRSIGKEAFAYCMFREISLPGSLISIGSSAFLNCTKLEKISLPETITSIGDTTFSGCLNLCEVSIGYSVSQIGKCAFSNCIKLKTVDLPNSIRNIGDGAFYGCTGLENITLPDKLLYLGTSAFESCRMLKKICIPTAVSTINQRAFANCEKLSEVTFDGSVISIGKQAFENCQSLSEISFPKSLEHIGDSAFRQSGVKIIHVSIGLKAIESNAFYNDNGACLTDIYYDGTEEQWGLIKLEAKALGKYSVTVYCTDNNITVNS